MIEKIWWAFLIGVLVFIFLDSVVHLANDKATPTQISTPASATNLVTLFPSATPKSPRH